MSGIRSWSDLGGVVCLLAACLVLTDGESAAAQEPCAVLERVSVASDGSQAQGGGTLSEAWGVSADGTFVAFRSDAPNLVSSDTNATYDIFVRDRATGETTRVSVASDGTEANGPSHLAAISPDARFVVFDSEATNLVPGDTNGVSDVFVHDRQTAETSRVSVASDGSEGNQKSDFPVVSQDGRYIAFRSWASNLIAGDTNGLPDIFVHDQLTNTTERVSIASDGTQASGGHAGLGGASISWDGRFVAFSTDATNLVVDDTNGQLDVFVHDRLTGVTERVSVTSSGEQATGGSSYQASISADGRFVAHRSDATNLVPDDTNGVQDIFVHDRLTGITERVSVTSAGIQSGEASSGPSLSANARYVGFQTWSALVPADMNNKPDVYVHDRATHLTEWLSVGGNHQSTEAKVSGNGRIVAFWSLASNLVPGDTNGVGDAFVAHNCLAVPPGAQISWVASPPPATVGGGPVLLAWELANFAGPITENQAHFGITSVLGTSPVQPGTNAIHSYTFDAPNIGWFDSPQTFHYIVRALDDGSQVLSEPAPMEVTVNPATQPTVAWITPPPASASSGQVLNVSWLLSNYVDPATTNAFAYGITTILGQNCDQPGGNGVYNCAWTVPPLTGSGTVYFTAYADNGIEFAFAPIVAVDISGP